MSAYIEGKALRKLQLGTKVERATANLTTGLALFNVLGGRVQLNLIVGEVTTIMEAAASASKLTADPTIGTTTDLCGTVEMNAAEAGTLITISGTAATAMQLGKSGSVRGQDSPVIVAVGAIRWVMAAPLTGSIKWTLFYIPIDDGAYVEAA